MRFIIIGAGGIGGAIGGRLADAGKDVVLVARGAHAAALRAGGLRLGIPERVIQVSPPVVESVEDLQLAPDDVLMLCVKSQDSASLLASLAALPVGDSLAGDVLPIVCAQNGISNEAMALRLFRHVHGLGMMLQATHLEPGRVSATGSPVTGILELGRYPSGIDETDGRIAAELRESGFLVTLREDVMAWKRAKLLRNLRNAIEAMCGADHDESLVAQIADVRALAAQEALACFVAAGMSVVDGAQWEAGHGPDAMRTLPVEGQGRSGSSTWQSLARGLGAVETDYLNGEIVYLGRLHGVATPVNERIQLCMRDLLRRGGASGSVVPADLVPVA